MNMNVTTRNLLERNGKDMPDSQRELILKNSWLGSMIFVVVASCLLIAMIVLYLVNNF